MKIYSCRLRSAPHARLSSSSSAEPAETRRAEPETLVEDSYLRIPVSLTTGKPYTANRRESAPAVEVGTEAEGKQRRARKARGEGHGGKKKAEVGGRRERGWVAGWRWVEGYVLMVVPPVRAFPSHGPFSPGHWCVPAEERREGSPEGEVLAAFSGEVTLVSRPPPGTGGNPKRCMRRPCSLAASQAAGVELRTFSSAPVFRPPILRRWHGWIKMRLVHLAWLAAGKDDSIGRATGISCRTPGSSEA